MIYFDEAGNTGDNLLDKDQPTYTMASHNFSNEEAKEILYSLKQRSKATELHFKSLKNKKSNQQLIIDCLNHTLITKGRSFFYIADKRFMVTLQIVDRLIEKVMIEQGVDIYKGGQNISTGNMIYIMAGAIWDKNLYAELCETFVKWTRSATNGDAIEFYESLSKLKATIPKPDDRMLLDVIGYSEVYRDEIASAFEKYMLDPTLSMFNAHCQHWTKFYNKPFSITFDDSKQISHWTELINFMTHELPSQEVGYGSRKYKYPLLIENLETRSSAADISIQLADIFASAANYYAGCQFHGEPDDFSRAIFDSKLFNGDGNAIWPTTKLNPEELDMTDTSRTNPLDFVANVVMQKPEAYKAVERTRKRKNSR